MRHFLFIHSDMLSFCDSTWSTRNGRCYKHFTPKVTWSEAQKTCQDNSGYLASIRDSDEMSFVNGKRSNIRKFFSCFFLPIDIFNTHSYYLILFQKVNNVYDITSCEIVALR
jgi:hypothetical protein